MARDPKTGLVWMGVPARYVSLVLLLHYSRVSPVASGRRYRTSTAVFLNEVVKLAICLTIALYEHSKTVPSSLPVTSLFASFSTSIFSGDSWKLVIPASLYTLSNSLEYVALSNLEAVKFQVTYQLKLLTTAIFAVTLLRKSLSRGNFLALIMLVVGVAIVLIPNSPDPMNPNSQANVRVPRSLAEFSDLFSADSGNDKHLTKRSATYEGIEEDLMRGHPHFNGNLGVLATLGACIASGLASVTFERVLRDSPSSISVWIRNVQLGIYSLFPALFIGVVFVDGEKVAKLGFFDGYNWVVGAVIITQAIGGIASLSCINRMDSLWGVAPSGFGIILSFLPGVILFDQKTSFTFISGTAIVLAATYLFYGSQPAIPDSRLRPPPIRIQKFEKSISSPSTDVSSSPPNDYSIKLPTTPLLSESALSTSRPGSPIRHHSRIPSSRGTFVPKQN
ncbi:hypothetical protein FQN57_007455 [Myotisia sp. PD_48]|nr:hypothetical protein FQN57_007455 [Myotisia sp. PD_48]